MSATRRTTTSASHRHGIRSRTPSQATHPHRPLAMRHFSPLSLAIALPPFLAFTLGGCRGASEAAAAGSTQGTAAIPVRVADVATGDVAPAIVGTGTLAPADELTLGFKIGGVVARLLVADGAVVRAGTPLATLDLAEIDAQVAKAASAAAKAERDLARVRALHADSVATLMQLQDATTGAEVARADLAAARFNRRFAVITAPTDGRVLRRFVEAGELVGVGTPVVLLGSVARGTVVKLELPDRDAVRVQVGDAAEVRLDALPDRPLRGRVREIAATATPGLGTYTTQVALEGSGGLAAGLVGRVAITPSRRSSLTLVPAEALVEADGDSGAVFVVEGTRAKRVSVRIAFVQGDRIALAAGLPAGRRVITDGAGYVEDGAAVKVTP